VLVGRLLLITAKLKQECENKGIIKTTSGFIQILESKIQDSFKTFFQNNLLFLFSRLKVINNR